ncbi:hypothetical protein M514_11086 [Trichuris suis]|uniref:Histone H2A n=1 Tax=Trichuris suis TaxID=68888 RepID=A0A085MS06_9BILA|nr:hypothetical protein M513_11086 [Trichuris suis]KFD60002.1 hypothetical protein M514_11086 [Trichuris suis]
MTSSNALCESVHTLPQLCSSATPSKHIRCFRSLIAAFWGTRTNTEHVHHIFPFTILRVMEYMRPEVLKVAGNASRDNKMKQIISLHRQLTIRADEELNKFSQRQKQEAEVLELAGNAAKDNKMKRIILLHQQLAIRADEKPSKFSHGITVSHGSILLNINTSLLSKKPEVKMAMLPAKKPKREGFLSLRRPNTYTLTSPLFVVLTIWAV